MKILKKARRKPPARKFFGRCSSCEVEIEVKYDELQHQGIYYVICPTKWCRQKITSFEEIL